MVIFNNLKKKRIFSYCIVTGLFLAIYLLPGLLYPPDSGNIEDFNRSDYNLAVIINTLPYIALVALSMIMENRKTPTNFGFVPFRFLDLPRTLLITGSLFLISILSSFLFPDQSPDTFRWVYRPGESPFALILLSCLMIAIKEEIFFRAFFLGQGKNRGFPPAGLLFCSAAFFSLGHLYQGFSGLMTAFLGGLLLGFFFLRWERILPLILGHGLYNALVLILSAFF